MKILIIGLPLFAQKLHAKLSSYDSSNKYYFLDTYYSNLDKVKALALIPSMDIIYSINGSLTRSRVFDLAILFRKKLIFHWVGTDVLKSTQAFNSGEYIEKYRSYPVHLCEVTWIQDELKQIGIEAEIQNFVSFNSYSETPVIPKNFSVLSYLHPKRETFYGIELLVECAERFPDIIFNLVGTSGIERNTPSNMLFHGWVSNMKEMIEETGVCVRLPEHDGLSSFVLESLSMGKNVIYSYDFDYCIPCENADELISVIGKLKNEFENGSYQVNRSAIDFIRREFSREKIFNSLIKKLTKN